MSLVVPRAVPEQLCAGCEACAFDRVFEQLVPAVADDWVCELLAFLRREALVNA